MRIALYTGTYQRDQDGVVRTLERLAASIVGAGSEVGVWSPLHSPIQEPGIERFKLPSVPVPAYPEYAVGFPSLSLARQLDEFAPQVVHISTPDLVGYYFLRYARRRKLPVISIYHTHFSSYLKYFAAGFLESLCWWFLRQFYNRCDRVFVPNKAIRDELQERGFRHLELWSRGIDTESFHPDLRSREWRSALGLDDKVILMFCGRLVWYKDLDVYARVYEILQEQYPGKFGFLLVGQGPIQEALQQRMPEAVFTGHLSREHLGRAFASSDLLLFPSTTETFGNVILEAMASGAVPLVSDQGGCQELVREADSGKVIAAGDVQAFAQAAQLFSQDKDLYLEHQQRGFDFTSRRDWPAVNATLLECYAELSR